MNEDEKNGNFVMKYQITFNVNQSNEIITVKRSNAKTKLFDSISEPEPYELKIE